MKTSYKVIIIFLAALIVGAVLFLKKESDTPPAHKSSKEMTDLELVNSYDAVIAETEVVPLQEGKLKEELSQAMEQLPMIADLQVLHDDEVHFTPELVNKGGALIGQILEAAENDPARREETLNFFKACAENSSLVEAIRAVCWRTTLSRIPKWEIFLPVSDAEVPQNIQDLAAELPEL